MIKRPGEDVSYSAIFDFSYPAQEGGREREERLHSRSLCHRERLHRYIYGECRQRDGIISRVDGVSIR